MSAPWTRFAALGDSFTEGMADETRGDGRHRGWADRVAEQLARDAAPEPFWYANLAVRGRLLPQVVTDQVPQAIDLRPNLVSLGAGVNDALRPRFDLNGVATTLERGTRDLRRAGIDVLLFAFGDPGRRSRAMAPIRGRVRALNSATRAIARHYGCMVVDFWGVAAFDEDRLWDEDRLHLAPPGHELAARAALDALGRPDPAWHTPEPVPGGSGAGPLGHARWVARHAGPWVGRRLRGQSSGDLVRAKDPQWRVIEVDGPQTTG